MKSLSFILCQLVAMLCVSQSDASHLTQKEEEENAIIKIMNVADSLFEIENYKKAINYYERIIRLSPNNTLAKNKINEINILLISNEDNASESLVEKIDTDEILITAKSFQEKRIESYQNNKRTIYCNKKKENKINE